MLSNYYGPQNEACDKEHAFRYRAPGESFREAMTRVASALADGEEHFKAIRDILLNMRFMPGGRIQATIGGIRATTPYNCFVSGQIEDSYVDGAGSIMARATEAAATMRLGGGIGYDFSTLRPRGALIKKLQSKSAGPVPFMEVYDAVCRATASSGQRRGAQMGVLRVDHPDIEEFIRAKQNDNHLTGFNISVAITDEFMHAVLNDTTFVLRWDGTTYREVRARNLWDMIMRSNFDWGEPGVLFIDTINRMNNLSYCETISATNPCGEQPLPPYGACLLGSFNLVKYLKQDKLSGPYSFNWTQFFLDIKHVVRMMDNVIDRAKYPLYEQEQEAVRKRRMGLGVAGAANCIEAMGEPYGSPGFLYSLTQILQSLRLEAYKASVELAKEKGYFPAMYASIYASSPFIKEMGEDMQEAITLHGIRNSHLLSIAPTGTIAFCADNISSGIEPVYAHKVRRAIVRFDGIEEVEVEDYGVKYLGVYGKTVADVTPQEHIAVLAAASKQVDSAVSKTCNVPNDILWDDFKELYMMAWRAGCKGCTTFREGNLRAGILKSAYDDPPSDTPTANVLPGACEVDPVTGRRSCE